MKEIGHLDYLEFMNDHLEFVEFVNSHLNF